ncbi:M48 family metalloprotease [Streptomyces clavifer]|uniref:M48 family metalloprotease n=1 Tax=Streptomyces clavifer TaxID=68188 RepID=UPI003817FB9E
MTHSPGQDIPPPPTYPGHPVEPAASLPLPEHPDTSAPAYPGTPDGTPPPPDTPDRPLASAPAPAPAYPGTADDAAPPPAYPAAPAVTAPPPAYPGTPDDTAPLYPGAPVSAAPAYPRDPAPPPPPGQLGPAPDPLPGRPEQHPHQMDFEQRRVHLTARQRGADATALSRLLVQVPAFLCSLAVVTGFASAFFGSAAWLPVTVWVLSGALVFHRPTESFLARRLLRLRVPTPAERARLEPVWREVTARAGVDHQRYELWIEESDDINAYAAAGHIVGVTTFSLNHLPNGQLAAALAHELGHHTGGHAWASLLGQWYAQPAELTWRAIRAMSRFALRVARVISLPATGVLVLLFGCGLLALVAAAWMVLLPMAVAPYLLALVNRRAELRADAHAAGLGFAHPLAGVLHTMRAHEEARYAAAGPRAPRAAGLAKLLSSHPDYADRLQRLQPYLDERPPR